mgnify:CR=1 FL=1
MESGGIFLVVIAAILVIGVIASNKGKKADKKDEDKQ